MQFNDLSAQQGRIRAQIDARISDVLAHGAYIMGPEVTELETQLSAFCGAGHSITCANGTDALQLGLMALDIGAGDAVFVPSFTFAATAEVVPLVGATPVFVDCDLESFTMDPGSLERSVAHAIEIGLRPVCIIAVDLFGQPADYDEISEIALAFGMSVISDCAQGFGGAYRGKSAGRYGHLSTTSFFPAKPLGCYGDGGAIFSDDERLAEIIRSLRIHGKGAHKYENQRIGLNSRLDTLQAAILCEKLEIFADELAKRAQIAARYDAGLSQYVATPRLKSGCSSSWAQYTIRLRDRANRDAMQAALARRDIPTQVYYPTPLHRQAAYDTYPKDPDGLSTSELLSETVLSLPMHPYLSCADQDRVIEGVKECVA
ncbi:MAG: DegT/DnrJ/EryC1/StrS aminotransferase family protein [Pseudomonadota bacterium]